MIGYLGDDPITFGQTFGFSMLPPAPPPEGVGTATATLVPKGSQLTFSRQQLVGRTGVLRGGTVAVPVRLAERGLAPPPPPPTRLPGFGDDIDPNAPQDVGPAPDTGAGAGGGAPSAVQIQQSMGPGDTQFMSPTQRAAMSTIDRAKLGLAPLGSTQRIYGMTPAQLGLAAAGTVVVASLGYLVLRKKRGT